MSCLFHLHKFSPLLSHISTFLPQCPRHFTFWTEAVGKNSKLFYQLEIRLILPLRLKLTNDEEKQSKLLISIGHSNHDFSLHIDKVSFNHILTLHSRPDHENRHSRHLGWRFCFTVPTFVPHLCYFTLRFTSRRWSCGCFRSINATALSISDGFQRFWPPPYPF